MGSQVVIASARSHISELYTWALGRQLWRQQLGERAAMNYPRLNCAFHIFFFYPEIINP